MAAAEILLLVSKALPIILNFMSIVISALLSIMITLIPFSVARAKNIPNHIKILIELFKNPNVDKTTKTMLAVVLIGLTGIIPFLAFSFIPFTGVPVVGLLTFPLACMLSFLFVCLSYEIVVIPLLESGRINLENIKIDLDRFKEDYLAVKNNIGPKWDKLVSKTTKLIEEHSAQIRKFGDDLDVRIQQLCDYIEEAVEPSIKELTLYLDSETNVSLSKEELDFIQEKLVAWKKVGLSGTLSLGVGIGSTVAAKSILVPATLWNSIIHSIGFGSGTIVAATTYSVATVYAPIAIGSAAFIFGIKGLKKLEKTRLSNFLADVIIAATPLMYADGVQHEKELSTIKNLMSNPSIMEKDRKRIEEVLDNPFDLDGIISNHIMHEKNGQKAKIKSRLLLSIAWQIARADGVIHEKEKEMYEQMARIFKVEDSYCSEVRALLMAA